MAAPMAQAAPAARQRERWSTIGWQGITLQVPEDWFPAALGTERTTGYLRVQSAEGPSVEVKWFSPRGAVEIEKEIAKYRRGLERAARKQRQTIEWRDKPKVPIREARPDKRRRFFGWRAESPERGTLSQALGVMWYCRTCGRVVIAQVSGPAGQEGTLLASSILNRIEDHGHAGMELWSLYGLQVGIPEGWRLEKHQLMAGYTMLQFRRGDRVLRAERWALANVALKEATLQEFVRGKSRKFWKDFRLMATDVAWQGHAGVRFCGPTRRLYLRVKAGIGRLFKRPVADTLSVCAWHCNVENKIFALHAIHPKGENSEGEKVLHSLRCH